MALTALARSRQTRDGVAMSGTFAARPKNAYDGALYYATDLGRQLFFDSEIKTWFPTSGRTLYVAGQKYLSDCFGGPALASTYTANIGTDTDPGDAPVIDTDDAEGSILGNTGNAGTGYTADASAICGPVDWEMEEAARRTIVFADFMVEAITSVEFFIGFSDTLVSTLEMPLHFTSGTAITAVADNACGLLFDTTADTDTIRLVGVAATVAATHVDTGLAPTAATYARYAAVIDTSGNMDCFINGTHAGTVASAIEVGTDACPIIVVNATTTSGRYWRCRRFACHQDW